MNKFLALIALGLVFVAGCDEIGNAPKGMSHDDAAKALSDLPPDAQIRAIAGSPMPQADKEKRYKEIEEKHGVKAEDVLSQSGAPTGPAGR